MTYSESSAALIIPLAALVILGAVSLAVICLSYKRKPGREERRHG